jgi:hypothetical protein
MYNLNYTPTKLEGKIWGEANKSVEYHFIRKLTSVTKPFGICMLDKVLQKN